MHKMRAGKLTVVVVVALTSHDAKTTSYASANRAHTATSFQPPAPQPANHPASSFIRHLGASASVAVCAITITKCGSLIRRPTRRVSCHLRGSSAVVVEAINRPRRRRRAIRARANSLHHPKRYKVVECSRARNHVFPPHTCSPAGRTPTGIMAISTYVATINSALSSMFFVCGRAYGRTLGGINFCAVSTDSTDSTLSSATAARLPLCSPGARSCTRNPKHSRPTLHTSIKKNCGAALSVHFDSCVFTCGGQVM